MLERIPDVPEGIVALKAIGTITRDDYEESIEPILDEAHRAGGHLRILLEIGPDYHGATAGAVWEKTETGLRHFSLLRHFDGYAIVTDRRWLGEASHLIGYLLPFPMRVFGLDERDKAVAWLSSLPVTAAPSAR